VVSVSRLSLVLFREMCDKGQDADILGMAITQGQLDIDEYRICGTCKMPLLLSSFACKCKKHAGLRCHQHQCDKCPPDYTCLISVKTLRLSKSLGKATSLVLML